MFTILSRIVHYGLKNFWRNGLLSTATVAIMTLAAVVFSGLILFSVVSTQAAASIQDKIDISVYFKTSTPEDQILSIKNSLESLSQVKSVEYVSIQISVCLTPQLEQKRDLQAWNTRFSYRQLGHCQR